MPKRRAVRYLTAARAFLADKAAAAQARLGGGGRSRFETREDVRRRLGVSFAVVIPDLASTKGSRKGEAPPDAVVGGANWTFAEAFQRLQRALGLGHGARAPLVLSICSALPGEGKTTVSACLARSAALTGLRVLLIDCDGRGRALSAFFAHLPGPGLVQLLGGEAELAQVTISDPSSGARFIRHSSDDRVQDLSTATRFEALLNQLRPQFDLVIVDTGPVLALAEARTIAALSDEVLLVTRWRKTPVEASRLALDLLRKAGATVTGVALTLVG